MNRLLSFLRMLVTQFGTLILFWSLLWIFGLKVAIAGSIVFVVIDGVRRIVTHAGFPAIYLLTSGLTLVFGSIDLYSQTPFMIKYEAVITNLVLAGVFAFGARGRKSMLQDIAEQQSGEAFEDRADIRYFLKLMTWMWAGYFVFRAGLYLWLGEIMPMERLLTIRPIIGFVTLGGMMLLSFQGQRLFALMEKWGMLPKEPEQPAAAAQSAE
jgi:intracellular septation protein A